MEINKKIIWDKVLQKINLNSKNDSLHFLLKNSKILEIYNYQVFIYVESETTKQILISNYYNDISDAVNSILNNQNSNNHNFRIFFTTNNNEEENKINNKNVNIKLFEDATLNNEYTFDNFVVGSFNEDAYKAALLISKQITQFNPLFIYSESGLGKTHLLNAIGNEIKKKDKNKNILYTSASNFFNEYIHIVKGEREEFQISEYFKKIDVLLIDDIQFCSKKPKFQELFFSIFSYLLNKNKPVVIASDRHPEEIVDLENRLVTRFLGGLTIMIKKPDFDSNVKIIKKCLEQNNNYKGKTIDNKIYSFIAEKYSQNIRELKGAVNHFIFFGEKYFLINNKNNKKINEQKQNNSEIKNKITIITSIIEKYFCLTDLKTLVDKKRNKNIIFIEHIRIFLIKNTLNIPLKTISKEINKKYTTVFQAFKSIKKRAENDKTTKKIISDLENKFLNYQLNKDEIKTSKNMSKKTLLIYKKLKNFIPEIKSKKISKTHLCKKFHISKNTLNKCIKYFNKQEFDKLNSVQGNILKK